MHLCFLKNILTKMSGTTYRWIKILMKKTIYYWSPCLAKIATIKATINSAISLAKYSKMYEVKIIDVCGEWSKHKNYLR